MSEIVALCHVWTKNVVMEVIDGLLQLIQREWSGSESSVAVPCLFVQYCRLRMLCQMLCQLAQCRAHKL